MRHQWAIQIPGFCVRCQKCRREAEFNDLPRGDCPALPRPLPRKTPFAEAILPSAHGGDTHHE